MDSKYKAFLRVFYHNLRAGKDPLYDPPPKLAQYEEPQAKIEVRCSSCLIRQTVPLYAPHGCCRFCHSKLSDIQIKNAKECTTKL